MDEISFRISLCEFEKEKKYKEKTVKAIISAICAMLNTTGGKVVIHRDNSESVDLTRILDQSMISIMGLEQTTSKINFEEDEKSIIVSVKRADSLITTNYNLHLPSQTQVVEVSPLKPPKKIKDNVMNRKVVLEPVELGTHCRTFSKNKQCGFNESTTCQFKNLKATSSKRTTLADRMTGKGNKFSCYGSAFANSNGGHIYYGITDGGAVEGEAIPNGKNNCKVEIIKKVEKALNKMIWPEQIGEPERGEHWEIFFEPVVDENYKPVPSTFVIVIYIAPCLGGVFTEEPECYKMVKGNVEKMSFADWKKRVLQLISWSSDETRKAFTVGSETLRKGISNGNWESVRNECNTRQNESDVTDGDNLRETMKLLILFKQIIACNRKGRFQKVRKSLMVKYKALSLKVQDSFIFEVLGLYLEAALKRASGDFEALKELLTEALSKAEQIEPGLVTATVYIFAATVSDLLDLELPVVLTVRALEDLKCVRDSPDVVADMWRKANIILATCHLGCNISGQLVKERIDTTCLKEAKTRIKAIYKSAFEKHPQTVYFDIQLNLVLSMFKYRHSQLYPDKRTRNLQHACNYATKARGLAVKHGFKEIVRWSTKNKILCDEELKRVETSLQSQGYDVRQRSTSRPRDLTQNAEAQVMNANSQNLDNSNVNKSLQTVRVLEHFERVPDSSAEVTDTRRKENINSAALRLGCNVSGEVIEDSIDISSLEKAKSYIKATYKSAFEEDPWSVSFDVQLSLLLSLFKYRHSQLHPDHRTRDLRDACGYAKKAQRLADQYGFVEMVNWSTNLVKRCDEKLNRAEIPVQNQDNDGRSRSRFRSSDVTQNAESQVVSGKTQNLDKPNVERNSQVQIESEDARLGARIKPTSNTVQESKAQDSGDDQARPQRHGVSLPARQKQLNTSSGQSDMSKYANAKPFTPRTTSPPGSVNHQISANTSPVPTQPETSAQLMNNAQMPMHAHGASAFEGNASYGRHIGTSPSQGYSDYVYPRLSQAQGPIHQLPPWAPSYPGESTYRGQVPNYPPPMWLAYQTEVPGNHQAQMIMAPTMAAGHDARFPNAMPEPMLASSSHGFLLMQQWPQQQQQALGNARTSGRHRTSGHQRQRTQFRQNETRRGRYQQ